MIIKTMIIRTILLLGCIFVVVSCTSSQFASKPSEKKEEIMVVYPDGTMMLNGRIMNDKDVVIYPDGYGGERAAVRVFVPLHPDFFRDTIPVERKDVAVERRE